jgi:O-antigen/teichoic acid export membrane protein
VYSLVVNAGLTSIVGVGFWLTAARLYDVKTVGLDAALIAAMMQLSTICQLNMVNYIIRFLPSFGTGTARAVLRAYGMVGSAAVIAGLGFALAAPLVSDDFRDILGDPAYVALYVAAQLLWSIFQLQDAVLAATRQAVWVPVENFIFGLLKLAALPLLLVIGAEHGIFLAWVLPIILLLIPVNVFLFKVAIPKHVKTVRTEQRAFHQRGRPWLFRFMALDYGATVLAQVSSAFLPLIVVGLLGSRENAFFAVPYAVVLAFTMLFYGAAMALVVEGAISEGRAREHAARVARRLALLLVPATLAMVAAAPLLLLPFGRSYAEQGTTVLRILAVGGLFRTVTTLAIAVARLEGKGARILALESLEMVLVLSGVALVADSFGIEGVAAAWSVATTITAVAALRGLLRFFRGGGAGPRDVNDFANPRAPVTVS